MTLTCLIPQPGVKQQINLHCSFTPVQYGHVLNEKKQSKVYIHLHLTYCMYRKIRVSLPLPVQCVKRDSLYLSLLYNEHLTILGMLCRCMLISFWFESQMLQYFQLLITSCILLHTRACKCSLMGANIPSLQTPAVELKGVTD